MAECYCATGNIDCTGSRLTVFSQFIDSIFGFTFEHPISTAKWLEFYINYPYFSRISIGKEASDFSSVHRLPRPVHDIWLAKTHVLVGTQELGFAPSPSYCHRLSRQAFDAAKSHQLRSNTMHCANFH
jgi:hypothetical protein